MGLDVASGRALKSFNRLGEKLDSIVSL